MILRSGGYPVDWRLPDAGLIAEAVMTLTTDALSGASPDPSTAAAIAALHDEAATDWPQIALLRGYINPARETVPSRSSSACTARPPA